jgi:hypothetical protein
LHLFFNIQYSIFNSEAPAHQHFIFQGSEGRYPLKEEVKVDDGLRKLAFLKPNIKLDNGSE